MWLNLAGIMILGLGGGLVGVCGLLGLAHRHRRVLQSALATVAGAAAVLAWLGGQYIVTAAVVVLVGAGWIAQRGRAQFVSARLVGALACAFRNPWLAWSSPVVLCPALALTWAWWITPPYEDYNFPTFFETAQREDTEVACTTDRGRRVRVCFPAFKAGADELAAVQHQMSVPNLICTGPPGPEYNCIGWVFTGGRYWVDTTDVQPILDDNGYRQVTEPMAGDVVVYAQSGKIVHAGVVRLADAFGVIVESKWDVRGRYLHTPEHQPYSADFAYYRSDRTGHLLRGLPADSIGETSLLQPPAFGPYANGQ